MSVFSRDVKYIPNFSSTGTLFLHKVRCKNCEMVMFSSSLEIIQARNYH
jgi:hypothetical protein